ncbi:MAG TPA: flavodoxin domain-containing protein [Longimicrobiales bacterium]
MARIFIVWSSTEGQTRRIVQKMEQEIRKAGHQLETINADDPPRGWIFSKADAVLVAASVHKGHYTEGLRGVLGKQSARFQALPTAFMSVSLSAARPETEQEAEGYIASLLQETGFKPALTVSIAGALRYPEYSFFKRRMMKSIAGKGGLPTDTSVVHEFTDWERVRTFTHDLIELAEAGALQHA